MLWRTPRPLSPWAAVTEEIDFAGFTSALREFEPSVAPIVPSSAYLGPSGDQLGHSSSWFRTCLERTHLEVHSSSIALMKRTSPCLRFAVTFQLEPPGRTCDDADNAKKKKTKTARWNLVILLLELKQGLKKGSIAVSGRTGRMAAPSG